MRIRIQLFTSMRIWIRILLLLLLLIMRSHDHDHRPNDPPGLYSEPPRLHFERPRPSTPRLHFGASKAPNFDFNADPDPAFYSGADQDRAFYSGADPDQASKKQCGSGSETLQKIERSHPDIKKLRSSNERSPLHIFEWPYQSITQKVSCFFMRFQELHVRLHASLSVILTHLLYLMHGVVFTSSYLKRCVVPFGCQLEFYNTNFPGIKASPAIDTCLDRFRGLPRPNFRYSIKENNCFSLFLVNKK
jgi:hypothetical protein